MLPYILSFFSGYVTSLAGTLIPGALNTTAMEITVSKGKKAGLLFGFGAALVEVIYIRLTLLGIAFFVKQQLLFDILEWTMAGLFFVAGVYIFINSYSQKPKKKKKKAPAGTGHRRAFLLGMALKAVNPAQFGFWIFWSTYLISQHLLKPQPVHYTLFVLGLGSATFTGYALYVYFGEYIKNKSFFTQKRFDRVVGIFLCLASLFWAARMLWFN
jgi:threonine/homoserine/homoserine lactone efflux protein